jgi:membrane associated rhomboid family serine protease
MGMFASGAGRPDNLKARHRPRVQIMGIHDREYYGRNRPGGYSTSGFGGRFRFMSFNGWLIIINVGIFLLGVMLVQVSRPVLVEVLLNPATAGVIRPLSAPPPQLAPGREVRIPLYEGRLEVRDGTTVFLPDSLNPVGSQAYVGMDPLMEYGHFSTGRGFFGLEVWRFITFQFLHANFLHLFFNMLGLFIFGGLVEQSLGSRRYAAFYLVCGIFGAVAYLLLNSLGNATGWRIPGLLPASILVPLIGASAGVFGVIMAAAYVAPTLVVQLLFPPIPLKLRTLAYAYVAIAVFNLLYGGRNAGGDAAHVGGAIAGFFFIRNAHLLRDFFDIFGDSRKGSRRGRGRPGAGGGGSMFGGRPPDQAEIDRILGKVASNGLQSLTDKEKRTLREATERQRGP